MRDLLPGEMAAFRRAEDAFRAAASRWGYREVRTPTIERYSLFTLAGTLTPQMLSRVYTFLDWDGWSGERVVLRPDSTIPVVRAAEEAGLPLPARLCYVQARFRYSHNGEESELWQGGLEYLGAPTLLGEVEVVAVGCETLEALGFAPTVRLAHVGVARALVEAAAAGDSARQRELTDRVAEEGLQALAPELGGKLASFTALALEEGEGSGFLANLASLAGGTLPAAVPALEELRTLADIVAASGRRTVIALGMPCDFEYYDGAVFEFAANGAAWGRGGRYRPPFGRCATACGLGIELSELAAALAAEAEAPPPPAVVPESPGDLPRALDVIRRIHRAGLAARLEPSVEGQAVVVRVAAAGTHLLTGGTAAPVSSLEELISHLAQGK
ncbi:ATP phosphoribosyltransferase regulatory subunit [bacterium HR29]|jgi:histidyl-tRNA synthetase|nr:ATP phosphoribosyltransferase regulatory subunit [bacterium HR29]